jgi:hypothetical protein
MDWPTPQDYQEALQFPQNAFSDPDLAGGKMELDKLGLPRPVSGGFASVYRVEGKGKAWAVRCFLRPQDDRERRYAAIQQALEAARLPCTVGFEYQTTGVLVRGIRFPILKMQWVGGESLLPFTEKHLQAPAKLLKLADGFRSLSLQLRESGIAHGDLQHGNIKVVDGRIILIDYDGMYVRSLEGFLCPEIGHRNYQHPGRSEKDYGPDTDNFSFWLIFISLVALAREPGLWQRHKGGDDCILFRREDLAKPSASRVFMELARSGQTDVARLARGFTGMISLGPTGLPPLHQFQQVVAGWNNASRAEKSSGSLPGWMIQRKPAQALEEPPIPPERDPNFGPFEGFKNPKGTERTLFILASLLTATVAVPGLLDPESIRLKGLALLAWPGALLVSYAGYLTDRGRNRINEPLALHLSTKQYLWGLEKKLKILRKRIALGKSGAARREAALSSQINRLGKKHQYRVGRMRLDPGKLEKLCHRKFEGLQAKAVAGHRAETGRLKASQKKWSAKLQALDRDLDRSFQSELGNARRNHVRDRLMAEVITYRAIPGVKSNQVDALVDAGVRCAGDITARVIRLKGIGPVTLKTLLDWRNNALRRAKETAPVALPRETSEAIRSKFEPGRVECRREIDAISVNLSGLGIDFPAKQKHLLGQEIEQVDQIRAGRTSEQVKVEEEIRKLDSGHRIEIARLEEELTRIRQTLAGDDQETLLEIAGLEESIGIWKPRLARRKEILQRIGRPVSLGAYLNRLFQFGR